MENIEILPQGFSYFDLWFKIIIIGDSGTGKSCFSSKAIGNSFIEEHNDTVGFELFTLNVRINNRVLNLKIWDTCGKELYRDLITNFYRNSLLAILIYSINNKESFQHIEYWLKDFRQHNFNG